MDIKDNLTDSIDLKTGLLDPGAAHINIYADFWRRLGAMLIDFIVLAPLIIVTLYSYRKTASFYFIASILYYCISSAYEILMLRYFGATLGKMAVHIKVIRTNGMPVGWKEVILRNIVNYGLQLLTTILTFNFIISNQNQVNINSILLEFYNLNKPPLEKFLGLLPTIWIWSELLVLLFNAKKRALHDFIAGTVVVKSDLVVKEQRISADRTELSVSLPQARNQFTFSGSNVLLGLLVIGMMFLITLGNYAPHIPENIHRISTRTLNYYADTIARKQNKKLPRIINSRIREMPMTVTTNSLQFNWILSRYSADDTGLIIKNTPEYQIINKYVVNIYTNNITIRKNLYSGLILNLEFFGRDKKLLYSEEIAK